jgi:hypothetical protein
MWFPRVDFFLNEFNTQAHAVNRNFQIPARIGIKPAKSGVWTRI